MFKLIFKTKLLFHIIYYRKIIYITTNSNVIHSSFHFKEKNVHILK